MGRRLLRVINGRHRCNLIPFDPIHHFVYIINEGQMLYHSVTLATYYHDTRLVFALFLSRSLTVCCNFPEYRRSRRRVVDQFAWSAADDGAYNEILRSCDMGGHLGFLLSLCISLLFIRFMDLLDARPRLHHAVQPCGAAAHTLP